MPASIEAGGGGGGDGGDGGGDGSSSTSLHFNSQQRGLVRLARARIVARQQCCMTCCHPSERSVWLLTELNVYWKEEALAGFSLKARQNIPKASLS